MTFDINEYPFCPECGLVMDDCECDEPCGCNDEDYVCGVHAEELNEYITRIESKVDSMLASVVDPKQDAYTGKGLNFTWDFHATVPEPGGDPRFHRILRELGELHDKKQADYGADDDPFANVRASEEWGLPAWVGAMVRANDKVRRLQTYAKKGTLANEGVKDSFLDLAVYAIIGYILFEEQEVLDLNRERPANHDRSDEPYRR